MKKLTITLLALLSISSLSGCVPVVVATGAVASKSITEERTVGDRLDDNMIILKIKERFMQTNVSEMLNRISVNSYEGRVMLTGSVPEHDYLARAAHIAWQVDGVKEVINEVVVKTKDFPDLAKESFIANTIRSKLLFEKDLSSNNYIVDVNDSVVYLLGVAKDRTELNKALEISRSVKGVRSVVNHVIIRDDERRKNK